MNRANLLRNRRILVVDDDPIFRRALKLTLDLEGAEIVTAASGNEALRLFDQQTFELVISDVMMPDGSGFDLIDGLKKIQGPRPPIILVTGYSTVDAEDAIRQGAQAVLSKPFKAATLITAALEALGVRTPGVKADQVK